MALPLKDFGEGRGKNKLKNCTSGLKIVFSFIFPFQKGRCIQALLKKKKKIIYFFTLQKALAAGLL